MALGADVAARLIECGALAPSGDNLQPWIVEHIGDSILVSVDRARDRSLYNFGYQASLIAIGAMAENMAIAAGEFGLTASVTISAASAELPSVKVTFSPGAASRDPLYPAIARRCTNRKPYQPGPLAPEAVKSLRAAALDVEGAELRLIDGRDDVRTLARAASLNDRLLFEIPELHAVFFESMRWTREEAERTRDGLFVDTLELGPAAAGFKAMRRPGLVRFTNALGASRLAPRHSYQTFLKSAALGFLQVEGRGGGAYIGGGRAMQRVWLTATALGLAFQPMAGMLYLLNYLDAPHPSVTPPQRATMSDAQRLYANVLPLAADRANIMLFRVGHAPPPSALSLRRPAV
ncbi:MAG: hypothetical protein ABI051_15880 [Vicinamibacterales bacterium]